MKKNTYGEFPVQIIVNGRAALTIMTHAESAAEREELVLGALFTERVVASLDDVESVLINDAQASVVTKDPYTILLSRKTVLAGCGGASSFLDNGKLGRVTCGYTVSEEVCTAAADKIPESVWYFAGLFSADGTLICSADDITAQNAADRIIGSALKAGVNPAETFAVLRGNCTVETMRKIIIAKIPVLVAAGDITLAALETASEAGVRIIRG
ncbi:MAG TPA: formate dehydrogenase accessory sulfurtransferase FdhD [Methanocorpusculum sp.]|nr:formate dehydrogenase accessory sulfurtransferase FdhD [Methanocorpusculum sp.]